MNRYDKSDDTMLIKTATYSSRQRPELRRVREAGFTGKGGLITGNDIR